MKPAVKKIIEKSLGVLGLVVSSGVVAALVTVYLTEQSSLRIENSRLSYEQKLKVIEQFDASQNELLSKLTLFNTDLLNGKKIDPTRKADVMQALVKAQISTNDIEEIVPQKDRQLIENYKKELVDLGDATQAANEPLALGAVFDSVNQLLPLHDQIGSDTRASLRVRGLFGG